MVNLNSAMKKLLSTENYKKETIKTKFKIKDVVSKTKIIKDCVIFDENEEWEETKVNFDRLLKWVGDWTGYEVSCNELRYSKSELPPNQFLCFVEGLNSALSKKYEGRKFVIIISVLDDGVIDLRFHTYRKKEGLWLNKNLNKYDNPVLYRI